jgi:hypothetical protein
LDGPDHAQDFSLPEGYAHQLTRLHKKWALVGQQTTHLAVGRRLNGDVNPRGQGHRYSDISNEIEGFEG